MATDGGAAQGPGIPTNGGTIVLSPLLPPDVSVPQSNPTLEDLQHDFDSYSWNTFIAANWPVGTDGGADPNALPGKDGDNPAVWEHWMPATSIFLANGAPPPAWGSPPVLPPICQGKLPRFPEGLVIMGDAACAFNPLYGQGMSVAGLGAELLDTCLREQAERGELSGLAQRFRERLPEVIRLPWLLGTGMDLLYPQAVGKRPFGLGLLHWYILRLMERTS
ncbi:FAD-dependent oxidoreductase, partial [Corallococcus sp. AB011P]|uniref:FAD-dependent oxidoreductase n=1 Tax=Corallococcus sp. AB011P TaxID=2316735 RepID=UPI0035168095